MLQVRMLGEFTVLVDGTVVDPPESRRAWSLLAWLALRPGPHPRGRLAAGFWPDTLDANARANLRSAIWSLRRALGPAGGRHLLASRELVGLQPDELWTDVAEFDRLLTEGNVEQAVELARGELLPGVEDDWVYQPRDEQRERLAGALGRLATDAERRGDPATAVEASRRQVALVPMSEEAQATLIRLLAASGDRPAAVLAYEQLRERFREELGLEPSRAIRRFVESLREPASEGALSRRPDPIAGRLPPLIGRRAELGALLQGWRQARAGRGGVIRVYGEAGIGKTRLSLELAARARADGGRVASCAALDLAGTAPFELWAELLRDIFRGREPPPLDQSWASLLPRLLPDLAPRPSRPRPAPPAVAPELERARLFEAIVEVVEEATRGRPLLLLMEDVHLADAPSLQLVAHVGRRLAALPLLIVLTRRDLPQRPDVDALEQALRSRGVLSGELHLGPLPDADVAALARAVAPLADEQVARVVAAADGSPLLTVETARGLTTGDRVFPESLRGVARASFRTLGPEARLVAEFAAVAGRELSREEIEALRLDRPHEAATAAVGHGLLVAVGTRIGYRHALLREAVYQDLPGPRRAWLHENFAAAIQSCRARGERRRAAEVARHLRLAGCDELAVDHLRQAAGDARAVAALSEASQFLTEAVEIEPDDPRLLLELAEVEAWRGNRDAADEAADRALALIGPADLEGQTEAWLRRGRWLRGALCSPRAARDAYRRALELIEASALPADDERAEALAGCAWAEAVAGDTGAVDPLLERLKRLPMAGTQPDLRLHDIGAAQSFSLIRRGRFKESYQPAVAAAEAAQRAGRPDMAYGCWANAASAAACAGDFQRSLEFAERGLAAVHRVLPTCEVHLLAARAHILARMGRLEEARAAVAAELRLAQRLDRPDLVATAEHDAGMVAFLSGDLELAQSQLTVALEAAAPVSRPRARLTRAEALARLGRLEQAEEELRAAALEPVTPSDFPHALVPRLTRIQGLIAAAHGDQELATRRLQEAAAGWRRYPRTGHPGEDYVANLADLGRPPVEGLIEPRRELEQVLADLDRLRAGVTMQ